MPCSVPPWFGVIKMGSEFQSQCEKEVDDINLVQFDCSMPPPPVSESFSVCEYGKSCAQVRGKIDGRLTY